MPEICRFYGIVIKMFFDDHNPPQFHTQYAGQEALIDIRTRVVISGSLPDRALGLVDEWTGLHRDELLSLSGRRRRTSSPSTRSPRCHSQPEL